MSFRQISSILFSIVLLPVHAERRTWTSADGKSTFEGQMLEYNATEVRVKRAADFKTFVLPLGKLSEADQDYVKVCSAKTPAAPGSRMAPTPHSSPGPSRRAPRPTD